MGCLRVLTGAVRKWGVTRLVIADSEIEGEKTPFCVRSILNSNL